MYRISLFAASCLAAVALALSGCSPATSEKLADDTRDEATGSAPDRALDKSPSHLNDQVPDATSNVDGPEKASDSGILAKYANLDPQHLIPRNLLAAALTYYDANLAVIRNKAYVSVIDFSLPSSKQRFWIINMTSGTVFSTTVAHGRGSDANNDGYADKFSNVDNSLASSLGIYLTDDTYKGSNGLSLRLDGKSPTNSNARARQVVIHGASYVQDREVNQGRSWGCPAVPQAYRDRIIGWLKGGSVLYANQSTKI